MRSEHLVDPELLSGLEMFPKLEFAAATLPGIRRQMQLMSAATPIPQVQGARLEVRKVRSVAGHEIDIYIHSPAQSGGARPAVLHIHGGGYVIGSARMSVGSNLQRALDADCVVASVDYRLAPETVHPGPVEDCYEALRWVHANAGALGIDAQRIAVMGESAGGGLAAALALLARDRGEVPIIHQHLIYPMIDDRTCVAVEHGFSGEFIWTPQANRFGWSSLLGGAPGGAGIPAYAAAARVESLAGLPGAFIAVGSLDLFVREDVDYARRLMDAGVPTELHVYPGAFHGFELVAGAQISIRAQQVSSSALRRALHASRIHPPT